jgi:hypothetical protein
MNINEKECTLIVFPFYPFNSSFQGRFMEKLKFKRKISTCYYIDLGDFSDYKELYNKVGSIIAKSNGNIILVSFSIFSQLSGELIKKYPSKIEGAVFVEPDFTNIIPNSGFKGIFKKRKLRKMVTKLLMGGVKVSDSFLYHGRVDPFFAVAEHIAANCSSFKLFDFINDGLNFFVIWSAMQNECWPLPQVLSEDYKIPVLNCDDNISSFLCEIDEISIDNI